MSVDKIESYIVLTFQRGVQVVTGATHFACWTNTTVYCTPLYISVDDAPSLFDFRSLTRL